MSSKSLLVQWAFSLENKIPDRTSVCEIIFKAFIQMPILWFFAGIVLIISCPFFIFDDFVLPRFLGKFKRSFIYAAIQDFKNKTCIMVEIEKPQSKGEK